MPDEPIPIDAVMTDLNSQWNASNVTKPTLTTVNGENPNDEKIHARRTSSRRTKST